MKFLSIVLISEVKLLQSLIAALNVRVKSTLRLPMQAPLTGQFS